MMASRQTDLIQGSNWGGGMLEFRPHHADLISIVTCAYKWMMPSIDVKKNAVCDLPLMLILLKSIRLHIPA